MVFLKKQILANGVKTFYWEKDRENEKVIILLHGFPGNHKVVIDMARNFKNFRVIVPDLPACGESAPLKEKHILKNYAEWLNNFLKNLSINKAVIIGYSFGTRVAITFYELYRQKTETLVLITPVVKPDSLIARIALLEYEIAEVLPDFLKKPWLNNKVYRTFSNMIIFKSSSKKRREQLIKIDKDETENLNPKATVELFSEFLESKSISEGIKINVKSLVIAADKDEIATVKTVEELMSRFSNAKLKIIKNAGHIVPGERPKKIAKVILTWLNNKK
jgi:pimeloyl-ACP methyl ester carboxylesterase